MTVWLTEEAGLAQVHICTLQAPVAMPRCDPFAAVTWNLHIQQVAVACNEHVHLQRSKVNKRAPKMHNSLVSYGDLCKYIIRGLFAVTCVWICKICPCFCREQNTLFTVKLAWLKKKTKQIQSKYLFYLNKVTVLWLGIDGCWHLLVFAQIKHWIVT